ncbi:MAG: maltose ABC transporter permease MalF, partial [Pantoea agglomerans]
MSGKPKTRSVLLKSVLIGICCLLVGYLLVLMYAQGEYLFALLTLILSATGL